MQNICYGDLGKHVLKIKLLLQQQRHPALLSGNSSIMSTAMSTTSILLRKTNECLSSTRTTRRRPSKKEDGPANGRCKRWQRLEKNMQWKHINNVYPNEPRSYKLGTIGHGRVPVFRMLLLFTLLARILLASVAYCFRTAILASADRSEGRNTASLTAIAQTQAQLWDTIHGSLTCCSRRCTSIAFAWKLSL